MKPGNLVRVIVLTTLVSVLGFSITSSQDVTDTSVVFNKIILTEEGVIAVDTIGNKWYYDFDEEQFLEGTGNADLVNILIEQRCTEKKIIKTLEKSATVGNNQYVDGNIIVYGKVTVNGWVKGSIKSLSGKVLVTKTGRVDGNIEAPDVVIRNGGEVLGEVVITDISIGFDDIRESYNIDGVIIVLSLMLFIFFVGFLLLTLIPKKIEVFNQCFYENKLRTTLVGLLSLILMPLLFALVIITIIGIVVTPFIPFIYLIGMVMGIVAFSSKLGSILTSRFGKSKDNIYFTTFIGLTLLSLGWALTAILLSMDETVSYGFGITALVLMILISLYPIFSGLGSAVLTRFGFRPYQRKYRQPSGKPSVPAPPPIPKLKDGIDNDNSTLIPPRDDRS